MKCPPRDWTVPRAVDKEKKNLVVDRYPFVLDVHSTIEGMPVGDGMVTELAPMMRYINRYARYIDTNLRYSAKGRMLTRRESGIDRAALADWSQDMIEGESIEKGRDWDWMQHQPFNGMITQQLAQMQADLKQDSGANQFTRGETTGGVVSARGIMALQEAGGKITGLRTDTLNDGFSEIVRQVLWLMAEFYEDDRVTAVTGRVPGQYGEYTQEAVRDYQMKNGLTADGIASDQTLSKLYGTGGSAMTPSSGLADLINQFNKTPGYTPKTDDEIRQQAEGEYKSYYDQLRLAAQQDYDRSDLALQQQKEGVQQSYGKQREQSAESYRQAYSQADRQMLSRGMQRSSYGAQTLSNIDLEGAEAQQAISEQQTAAEGNIDAQRSQLAQQLAAQLSQYDSSKAADVLARIRELEDQEYDRGVASANTQNSLASQIYQFLYQEQRDNKSDYQWQKEFDANYGTSGSGSGSGSGATGQADTTAAAGASTGVLDWATFMSLLAGLESGTSKTTDSGSRFLPSRVD